MKKIIVISGLIFTISSCLKDVTVNISKEPSKIVVNGLVSANGVFGVTVGKTAYIMDNLNSYNLTNANVDLYENNILKERLVYDSNTQVYSSQNTTQAIPGNVYSLKVSAPDFTTVESSTFTPDVVPILSITRRQNAKTNDGTDYDEIKFSFNDNGANEDYYMVKVSMLMYMYNNMPVYGGINRMKSSDIDVEGRTNTALGDFENSIDKEFLMTDKNYNGRKKEVILFIEHEELESNTNATGKKFKPVIELLHITKDHYRYRKSLTTYEDAKANPFAEPVLVHGNVKNGYGIFSVYNISTDTIR